MLLSRVVTKAFFSAYTPELPVAEQVDGTFDLLRYGFVENARETVGRIKESEPGIQRIEWLEDACGRVEIYHKNSFELANGVESVHVQGLADPIKARAPTDVMIVRAEKADHALVAFGGATEAFWLPPPLLELPKTHIVILRDSRRLWHLTGVDGLGANYQECVAALRQLIESLGVAKTVFVGSSSGGYSALRYALDLNPAGVLAISPMTGTEDLPKLLPRFPALRPLYRAAPEMMGDLVPLYREHPNPPKVIVVWGEKHPVDTEQAVRMKGLPNVTLEPVRGVAAHPAWVKLLADGQLEPLLRRLLLS